MKLFVYQFISSLAGLLGWPVFYHHLKSRGQGESFFPRLGLQPPPEPPPGAPRLWLHGVSVGEVLAAVPLVAELKALLPKSAIILSTGTETGQAVARREFLPLGALVCYFPLDLPWAVRQALDMLKPDVFVALESEVWPTFLTTARKREVPLALMNARLSDHSFQHYVRYKKYVFDFIDLFFESSATFLNPFSASSTYPCLSCTSASRNRLSSLISLSIFSCVFCRFEYHIY